MSAPQRLSTALQAPDSQARAAFDELQTPLTVSRLGTGCPLGVRVVQVPLGAMPAHHSLAVLHCASTEQTLPQTPLPTSQMMPPCVGPAAVQSALPVQSPQVPLALQ